MQFNLTIYACLALTMSGCVTKVSLRYQPSAPAQPLAGEKKPKLFVGEVTGESYEDGHWGGIKGAMRPIFVFADPVLKTIREGLQTEFLRLGIPLSGNAREADIVVKGELREVNVYFRGGQKGGFEIELMFLNKQDQPLWKERITGQASQRAHRE